MANSIDQVDQLFKRLQTKPLSQEAQEKLDKKIRLEFNYNSNHMEGNTLTYDETALLLFFDDTKGSHTMREYEEMKAHDAAYRLVQEWSNDKERPLTEQYIKNLNEIILVRPFWKEAITPDGQNTRRLIKIGDYKEYPNSVRLHNGEIFHYASPIDTPILMKELIEWYKSEEKQVHPVTLASMLHYKFVRIHPFDDGNGRVARLLMNYVLLRSGYPPVIIKSEDKANYLRVLRSADIDDYEPLISYIGNQLVWILSLALKAANGENIDEPGDFAKKVRALKQRLNTDENTRVKLTKSINAIKNSYQHTIHPAISSVNAKLAELDPLFKSSKESLVIIAEGKPYGVSKNVETFHREITDSNQRNYDALIYNYSLSGLRNNPNKNFNITISLSVAFHMNVLEFTSNATKLHFEKLYDEIFLEAELTAIGEGVGNFVIESIEGFLDIP